MPGHKLTQREQGNRQVWDGFQIAAGSYHNTKKKKKISRKYISTSINLQDKKHAAPPLCAADRAAMASQPATVFSCWEKG